MQVLKLLTLTAVAGLCFTPSIPQAQAQVSVEIGAAPECPYGYFEAAPYRCAPYGYYGPKWFAAGTFVGAGPWFHGENEFRGEVNNRYSPEHGYKGAMPERGERARAEHAQPPKHFKGNETRDGRGHVGK
jgi:hypothetical protein